MNLHTDSDLTVASSSTHNSICMYSVGDVLLPKGDMAMRTIILVLAISSVLLADRFEVDDQGVIYDSETGLHWYCSDDGNSTFSEMESWIESINESRYPEGSDWRLPTLTELEDLYWDAGITWEGRSSHTFYFSRFITGNGDITYPNKSVFCFNSSGESRRFSFYDGEVRGVGSMAESKWAVR